MFKALKDSSCRAKLHKFLTGETPSLYALKRAISVIKIQKARNYNVALAFRIQHRKRYFIPLLPSMFEPADHCLHFL
jgi:hypothetical protein